MGRTRLDEFVKKLNSWFTSMTLNLKRTNWRKRFKKSNSINLELKVRLVEFNENDYVPRNHGFK